MPSARRSAPPPEERQQAMRVVERIRMLLQDGTWKPGDKLPPEREFARTLRISRSSLRAGIGYLAAMGLLQVRHGVGAFIADQPTQFGAASLPFLNALQGYDMSQMFESRRILECQAAALAAERTTQVHLQAMAEELDEMDATADASPEYLIHDVRFHRIIAQAAGNTVLAAIIESLSGSLYEERRTSVEQTGLAETTVMHRAIYRAIRSGNARAARLAMERHLHQAEASQKRELPRRRRLSRPRPTAKAK